MSRVPHTFSSGTPVTWAGTLTGTERTLFKHTMNYNAWDQLTSEHTPTGFMNGQDSGPSSVYTQVNNRMTHDTPSNKATASNFFDADGRFKEKRYITQYYNIVYGQYIYEADGSLSVYRRGSTDINTRTNDGDGWTVRDTRAPLGTTAVTTFNVRSSLFGGDTISEVKDDGSKKRTFVYGLGRMIALQSTDNYSSVVWEHRDSLNSQYVAVDSYGLPNKVDLDPKGAGIPPQGDWEPPPFEEYPWMDDSSNDGGCYVDGIERSCGLAENILNTGGGVQCPYASCGPVHHDGRWYSFSANAYRDGYSGYGPLGSIYSGAGRFSLPQRTPPQPSSPRPSLKSGKRLSPSELAERRAQASTGIFDNEANDELEAEPTDPFSAALFYQRLVNGRVYREATIDAAILNTGQGNYIESSDGRERLKIYLRRLMTPECAAAFKAAGLDSPYNLMRNGSVIFAARELLNSSRNNAVLGISEDARIVKNQSNAPETTLLADESVSGTRGVIFVRQDAFTTTSNMIFTDFAAHGMVHAQNVRTAMYPTQILVPFLGLTYGHDLSAFPGYERIVAACGNRRR